MRNSVTGKLLTLVLVGLVALQACARVAELSRPWPRDELFGTPHDSAARDAFWPLPPVPAPNDRQTYDLLQHERDQMVKICYEVLDYFQTKKKIAWWKEFLVQGSEIGIAAAVIVLAAANPAANAAMIGILGGIGGLGYFTMWPFMNDVVDTENDLVAEVKKIRNTYGHHMIVGNLTSMRSDVDKAKAECVLSKEKVTVPPERTPNIQQPPVR